MAQGHGMQVAFDGKDEKAAVGVAAPYGPFELVLVVEAEKLQVDAGVLRQKRLRHAREPLDGRAGERPHAHDAAREVLELGHARLKPALVGAHAAHPGKELGAVGGQTRAAVVPHEQR